MTRNNYLKRDRNLLLTSFLAILFFVACQKQPTVSFGTNFVQNNNNAKIVVADTFNAELSTLYLDSFATAGTGTMLIGEYQDPFFGKVSSRSFLEIAPPSTIPTISNYGTYDSVALIMRTQKGSYYGDTTIAQSYSVYRVTDLYRLPYQQFTFYNHSSFPIDPASLGSQVVTIAPNAGYTTQYAGDSVKIKLSNTLGQDLYNKLYNRSDTVTNLTNFLYYFRGLAIAPSPGSSGVVFGFRDSAILRVYYHEPGVLLTSKFIDFGVTDRGFQFNNITTDRTGTALANLVLPTQKPQTPPLTPSAATGGAAYFQPATGLLTKISFPSLRSLALRPDYLSVLRATLTVRPVQGDYSTLYQLPPQINLFLTDKNNLPGGALSGQGGALNGDLQVDYLYGINTAYTYDLTPYIQQQIALTTVNENGLIMNTPQTLSNTSFNRVVLADKSKPITQRISLKIYYVSLYLTP